MKGRRTMKSLPITIFALCSAGLIGFYLLAWAGIVIDISADANNPGGETGSYLCKHWLAYPNGMEKPGCSASVTGTLSNASPAFSATLRNIWRIVAGDPPGDYTHRAYPAISVPGETRIAIDVETFHVK